NINNAKLPIFPYLSIKYTPTLILTMYYKSRLYGFKIKP
ncbi:unnamed protein product, partial [marine sediment metagenome]